MNLRKYIFLIFVILFYSQVLAQVDTAWVRYYNGQGNERDWALSLAVDGSGNVYVTGLSGGSGTSLDYATIKYAPNGDTLWVRRYNGQADSTDRANSLAVDSSGNVYVTGFSVGIGTSRDYATIKYAPNGDILWVSRYNGMGNTDDEARALTVGKSGNVYVTGASDRGNTLTDFTTIKYSPDGDTIWVRHYNGTGNSFDLAFALAVDDNENVYVAGSSFGTKYFTDYVTIKYAPNGDTLWVRRYNGNNDPLNSVDVPTALALDDSGNVYVTGYSQGINSLEDYLTIKYASNGDTIWVRRYNGPLSSNDWANDVKVDGKGNVYVCGSSTGNLTSEDYATIGYASNGDTLWVRRYNGSANANDRANVLAVDDQGNVYVTGTTNYWEGTTIKYMPTGNVSWITHQGTVLYPSDILVASDPDENKIVYVVGEGLNEFNNSYVTIKYLQFNCLAKPGDTDSDSTIQVSDVVTIVNYLFKSQPAPNPLCRADANADGNVLLSDIVYLINFIFKSGPAPLKSKECCL